MIKTIKQFKSKRKKLSYTQKGLAEKMGVSHKTIESWEQGRNPVPQWAYKLMESI